MAEMDLAAQVGQLFMVGVLLGKDQSAAVSAVTDRDVANIFLEGRSTAPTAEVATLVEQFTSLDPAGLGMFVAVNQEGGNVQTLQGEGFSAIPTALEQAQSGLTATQAEGWGSELAAAGVNLNLAPVADLVDIADPTANEPIGYWQREYGTDAATVEQSIGAFISGMNAAGVGTVIKHFPGLGRTTGNTDTADQVTDTVTQAGDAAVEVFAAGIADGADMVMASTAVYTQIDPDAPAAFSPVVIDGLLRTELGYDGVCITDDVSGATQVLGWTPAERAVLAIEAGCDIVLVSNDPNVAAEMVDAVVARAEADPEFAARVGQSAQRVVKLKLERLG